MSNFNIGDFVMMKGTRAVCVIEQDLTCYYNGKISLRQIGYYHVNDEFKLTNFGIYGRYSIDDINKFCLFLSDKEQLRIRKLITFQ